MKNNKFKNLNKFELTNLELINGGNPSLSSRYTIIVTNCGDAIPDHGGNDEDASIR